MARFAREIGILALQSPFVRAETNVIRARGPDLSLRPPDLAAVQGPVRRRCRRIQGLIDHYFEGRHSLSRHAPPSILPPVRS